MCDNDDRVRRFAALLPHYPEDDRTNLIDLIADAQHWCDRNGEDFDAVLRIARMHFEAEVDGDE